LTFVFPSFYHYVNRISGWSCSDPGESEIAITWERQICTKAKSHKAGSYSGCLPFIRAGGENHLDTLTAATNYLSIDSRVIVRRFDLVGLLLFNALCLHPSAGSPTTVNLSRFAISKLLVFLRGTQLLTQTDLISGTEVLCLYTTFCAFLPTVLMPFSYTLLSILSENSEIQINCVYFEIFTGTIHT
jgi:hypothetical protein